MEYLNKFIDWLNKNLSVLNLNWQIRNLNKELTKIYARLGEDYVETHRNDPNDINKDLIDEAVRLQKAIHDRRTTIDELRGIRRCAACEERIPSEALFCPYCGLRQPDPEVSIFRYCPECGTKLEVDEKYCHQCGAAIPQDDVMTEEMSLARPVIVEEEKAVPVEQELKTPDSELAKPKDKPLA